MGESYPSQGRITISLPSTWASVAQSRNLRTAGLQAHLRNDFCIDGFYEIQNHVNDGLIANRGIDHGVVNGAIRPFDAEILLDEIDALAVNGIHELPGFLLALATSQQAPHFILSRSVKKHTQRIWAVPEKMLGPPSDDDGVSGLRCVLNDSLCNLQNGFAVHDVQFVCIEAAFITPAQKGFE